MPDGQTDTQTEWLLGLLDGAKKVLRCPSRVLEYKSILMSFFCHVYFYAFLSWLKFYLIFSCEDAAQQVLMSVCPCVRVSVVNWSRMSQNACKMFQNVPEGSRRFKKAPQQVLLSVSSQEIQMNEYRRVQTECAEWACMHLHELAYHKSCYIFKLYFETYRDLNNSP